MPKISPSQITAEIFRMAYTYDAENGVLRRDCDNRRVQGKVLRFLGEGHSVSRWLWLHYYGEWPPLDKLVDHKDRNRNNWRISNLRLANYMQNAYNATSRNPEFPKGVVFNASRTKCWAAYIRIEGKKTNLGRFLTMEEAAQAYIDAAAKHHGEFVCLTKN